MVLQRQGLELSLFEQQQIHYLLFVTASVHPTTQRWLQLLAPGICQLHAKYFRVFSALHSPYIYMAFFNAKI